MCLVCEFIRNCINEGSKVRGEISKDHFCTDFALKVTVKYCPNCGASLDLNDNGIKPASKGFKNSRCEYYPCHEVSEDEEFNCMFCYCPLHHLADCGGNFTLLEGGHKDCSKCLIPHKNYDYIIQKLRAMY